MLKVNVVYQFSSTTVDAAHLCSLLVLRKRNKAKVYMKYCWITKFFWLQAPNMSHHCVTPSSQFKLHLWCLSVLSRTLWRFCRPTFFETAIYTTLVVAMSFNKNFLAYCQDWLNWPQQIKEFWQYETSSPRRFSVLWKKVPWVRDECGIWTKPRYSFNYH